jgi:hypothetical protein
MAQLLSIRMLLIVKKFAGQPEGSEESLLRCHITFFVPGGIALPECLYRLTDAANGCVISTGRELPN